MLSCHDRLNFWQLGMIQNFGYETLLNISHFLFSHLQNFYLIDKQLILFCGLVLVRRLVWTLIKRLILAVTPSAWAKSFVIVARYGHYSNLFDLLIIYTVMVFDLPRRKDPGAGQTFKLSQLNIELRDPLVPYPCQ